MSDYKFFADLKNIKSAEWIVSFLEKWDNELVEIGEKDSQLYLEMSDVHENLVKAAWLHYCQKTETISLDEDSGDEQEQVPEVTPELIHGIFSQIQPRKTEEVMFQKYGLPSLPTEARILSREAIKTALKEDSDRELWKHRIALGDEEFFNQFPEAKED